VGFRHRRAGTGDTVGGATHAHADETDCGFIDGGPRVPWGHGDGKSGGTSSGGFLSNILSRIFGRT
jgi:hypothetical protein